MAYTINLTNGALFATIPDGTINTASSMVLVGKNYAGYGEFLDENFIHLLENGSNSTAPGAPLTGQLWWDSTNGLMKVYNGTGFKTISASTAQSTPPTNNVQGDLWYDTANAQLKVWTGSAFILVGPASSSGQGTTGAIVATIADTIAVDHVVLELYVANTIVGMVSKDSTFTPGGAGVPGGWGVQPILPGITLGNTVASGTAIFAGTALDSQTLDGLDSAAFLRSNANDTTSGSLGILNDVGGLSVGADSDARITVNPGTSDVTIRNQTSGANLYFGVNVAGNVTPTLTIFGANGTVSGNQINANYADVAERFAADEALDAGTVVELGGIAEITKSMSPLSENVFGVVSTRAAYLMNSGAGPDATHPPVAMTGRVPVKVVGIVHKGDRLVSAGNGCARSAMPGEATAFNVIGRSLDDKLTDNKGFVEAIVTIK
jgi:hypothetical protein